MTPTSAIATKRTKEIKEKDKDSIATPFTTQIGKLIETMRLAADMTQAKLAECVGTTQSAIARIENGEQNITAEMIEKISSALNRDLVKPADGAINIKIEGGQPLTGEIATKTSKNGALGILAASLLNRGTTTIKNVPKIEEIKRMIEVFESIGINVSWNGSDLSIRPPKTLALSKLDKDAAERTRAIIMLIGPLIHHSKKFNLPQAGGCKLGSRTVRPHIYALEKFGVQIETKSDRYEISAPKLKPAEIVLYESGDTVTENAIIAAALIPGKTIIKYASANYMGQEVCFYLEQLGVKIEGVGTTTITVHGVDRIEQDITYYLSEDPIESMFFLAAAIVTKSTLIVRRCPIDFLEIELLKLEKMGFKYKILKRYKALNGKTNLVDIETRPSTLTALEEKIESRPYPGLNIDNLPFFAVIATQAKGTTLIHDWVYEKRAIYTKDLDKLGADTVLVDPHRLYVVGPTKLKAAEVICPPALRPGAIILIGMLAAQGTSILRHMYSINRGYEDLIERLNSIGAKISILR